MRAWNRHPDSRVFAFRLPKTRQDKLNKYANRFAVEFIARECCPELSQILFM